MTTTPSWVVLDDDTSHGGEAMYLQCRRRGALTHPHGPGAWVAEKAEATHFPSRRIAQEYADRQIAVHPGSKPYVVEA